MSVEVASLTKSFGESTILKSITETFASNEISVLLGPSGCGKTTTLRCIAGLERPEDGRITIDDRTVYQQKPSIWVPVERRKISMVFQSYAIWPHMTVFQNVSLPLRAAGMDGRLIAARVADVLDIVGLKDVSERSATQLSGGQQQRVALARCAVADSPIILMDEPLSNLDARLRVAMRGEIVDLQRRLQRTVLFVTHDQEEAMSIADTIYLFHQGTIVQKGPPRYLYENPRSCYAAEFFGRANIIPHLALEKVNNAIRLGNLDLAIPDDMANQGFFLCIRPEKWRVGPPDADAALNGNVRKVQYLGDRTELWVDTPIGQMLVIEMSSRIPRPGELVGLGVEASDVRFLENA
jgi:ABC-type sugar transport system ATPase subunit